MDLSFAIEHEHALSTTVRGLGLSITNDTGPTGGDGRWDKGWSTITPFWMLTIVFALLPMTWMSIALWRRRRRKRIAAGLCARCGYDLRASAEICPECGTARPIR